MYGFPGRVSLRAGKALNECIKALGIKIVNYLNGKERGGSVRGGEGKRGGDLKVKLAPQLGPFIIISCTQSPKSLPVLSRGTGKYLR